MQQTMIQKIHIYATRNRYRRMFRKFVQILACIVVFCTTYALILPAITLEQNVFCGMEEHVHVTECYPSEKRLICAEPDGQGHTHSEICYTIPEERPHSHSAACEGQVRGDLTCTEEEMPGHTHGDSCYAVSEILECSLPVDHVHGDSCHSYPLICTRSTDPHVHSEDCFTRGDLICGVETGHIHGSECTEEVLSCINLEEDHEHTDECHTPKTVCSIPENHSHETSCYTSDIVCGIGEGHIHAHDAVCYSTEAELTCTLPEQHIHDNTCFRRELICTTDETSGHTHGDDCNQWEPGYVCGMEAGDMEQPEPELTCTESTVEGHIHKDSCYEILASVCSITDPEHIHTEVCQSVICGQEAHSHTLACYSDPEADLETREIWEATFAEVELTGKWNEDVLVIAQTQLGYAESSRNYAVWEDDTTHGYTRYGAWYGSPYGDWCAMFTSFCLHYAEVEGMPLHWGVRPWIEELTELKLYHEADVYEPKPGDIIFYDWEGDGLSDHVGIVAEIIVPEEDETSEGDEEKKPARVKAIEGNSSNLVQYVYYDIDDDRILGYSELPDNLEVYSCGILRHSHNEYCYNEEENFICQQLEHAHIDTCELRDAVYCGFEEHTHIETCYDPEGNLICGCEEHIHNESCTVEAAPEEPAVYYCGLEEHFHSETCYDGAGALICETPEHTHTEECSIEITTYYCGFEEHTHIEICYNEMGELVCVIPEHAHTEECSVEPVTYYCGFEEHTHIETCYDEAGEQICEIAEHVHTDACLIQPVWLCGKQEHSHEETCYNEAGELICKTGEHTHTDECSIPGGYVCGLAEHIHDENCYDAEGVFICLLQEHIHNEACRAQNIYACGLTEHTHTEICYDESGDLICRIPEHLHTKACVGRNLYYSDMQIRVHALIQGVENLPEKLSLKVKPVIQEDNPESFGSMQVALSEQISNHEQYLSTASFFEMYLLSENQVYELPETANVTVTMEFEQPIFTAEDVADSVSTQAFMITPEGGVEYTPEEMPEEAPQAEETPADESNLLESVVSAISDGLNSILTPAHALEDLPDTVTEGENPGADLPEDSGSNEEDILTENPDTENMGASNESEPVIPAGPAYEISSITGEDYGNPSQGITSVTFQTNRISTFVVALANTAEAGPYWERIESTAELNDSNAEYLIISAEGNYAFQDVDGSNAVPVTLHPVKGRYVGNEDQNRKYYRIAINGNTDSTPHMLWTITPDDSGYLIQNLGSTQYLHQMFASNNTATGYCTLTYWDSPDHNNENCWRSEITYKYLNCTKGHTHRNNCYVNSSFYLQYHPKLGSSFVSSNAYNENSDGKTANSSYSKTVNFTNGRDMLIFKKLDENFRPTSPPDVLITTEGSTDCLLEAHTHDDSCEANCEILAHTHDIETCQFPPRYYCGEEHEHTAACPTKPPYDDFRLESRPKEGETGVSQDSVTVKGKYYSDEATSNLEQYFRKDSYEASRVIDGMVRTDKSVIYGYDDYEAFTGTGYASNTFSVTMSALGQAYPIPNEYTVQAPVDVVFVLDTSGSMSIYPDSGTKRAVTLVEALNKSIKQIQDANSENRVGVVLYAQGVNELLPLDRYTANGDEFFVNTENTSNNVTVGMTGAQTKIYRVHTSSSLKSATTNETYYGQGADTYQGFGTYTQAGIAMGSKVFHDVTDTTYYKTFTDTQGNEYEFKVQRQPVFVLLSDGEPTYSTNMYMDALNGVHYGDGNGGNNNVKGIHGFYTILSANYYKRMVGIHYQRPALFYSIGLGIQETGGGSAGTTDAYKRAVLNPSAENIAALTSDSYTYNGTAVNTSVTSRQLHSLLTTGVSDQYKETYVIWPDDWTGVPHLYEPTMSNPYSTNYSYADGAFFGEFNATQLLEKFNAILTSSLQDTKYGFVLMKNTGVHMTDYIGAGMEIKGDPVLRYGGQNFTKFTTRTLEDGTIEYTYSGEYRDPYIPNQPAVDISRIKVYVKKDLTNVPIYMCGREEHTCTDNCAADCALKHQHSEESCGIYRSYLCGQHVHRKSCEDGSCGYMPHDHDSVKCQEVTTTQRIQIVVPDDLLPVYTPDLERQEFYYEALPVRLIYQVGLTEEAEQAVLKLNDNGGNLTFYTNRWGGSQHARTDLFPSEINPFYHDIYKKDQNGNYVLDENGQKIKLSTHKYTDHTMFKDGTEIKHEHGTAVDYTSAVNVTGTEDYTVDCHWSYYEYSGQEVGHVYHELGNNGKLVFGAEKVEIPVEKVWEGVNASNQNPVTLTLYQVVETTTQAGTVDKNVTQIGSPITLSVDNEWKSSFQNLPVPNGFYYAIVETPVPGFHAEYSGGNVIEIPVNGSMVNAVKVTDFSEGAKITVTNRIAVELPETGGPGITLHTAGGLLMISVSLLYAYVRFYRKRRGEAR